MSKYSTEELVKIIGGERLQEGGCLMNEFAQAIISRLRAADELAVAARKVQYHGGIFETGEDVWREAPVSIKSNRELIKAIAVYEGRED